MGCFLGLHQWVQAGEMRKCSRCGEFQRFSGTIDDPNYWITVRDPSICETCNGDGRIYNPQGVLEQCKKCAGTGKR